jgi:hypothetical protein
MRFKRFKDLIWFTENRVWIGILTMAFVVGTFCVLYEIYRGFKSGRVDCWLVPTVYSSLAGSYIINEQILETERLRMRNLYSLEVRIAYHAVVYPSLRMPLEWFPHDPIFLQKLMVTMKFLYFKKLCIVFCQLYFLRLVWIHFWELFVICFYGVGFTLTLGPVSEEEYRKKRMKFYFGKDFKTEYSEMSVEERIRRNSYRVHKNRKAKKEFVEKLEKEEQERRQMRADQEWFDNYESQQLEEKRQKLEREQHVISELERRREEDTIKKE